MPRLTIDTTQAQSFEPVEPGPYHMRVESVSDPHVGEKSHYVEVKFAFNDPLLQQKAGGVRRMYPIDGKGSGFFIEFWKALTGEKLEIGGSWDIDTDQIIGREVIVDVENREYEGRLMNEVKKVVAS